MHQEKIDLAFFDCSEKDYSTSIAESVIISKYKSRQELNKSSLMHILHSVENCPKNFHLLGFSIEVSCSDITISFYRANVVKDNLSNLFIYIAEFLGFEWLLIDHEPQKGDKILSAHSVKGWMVSVSLMQQRDNIEFPNLFAISNPSKVRYYA